MAASSLSIRNGRRHEAGHRTPEGQHQLRAVDRVGAVKWHPLLVTTSMNAAAGCLGVRIGEKENAARVRLGLSSLEWLPVTTPSYILSPVMMRFKL